MPTSFKNRSSYISHTLITLPSAGDTIKLSSLGISRLGLRKKKVINPINTAGIILQYWPMTKKTTTVLIARPAIYIYPSLTIGALTIHPPHLNKPLFFLFIFTYHHSYNKTWQSQHPYSTLRFRYKTI